jgi:hypothetical protein
MENLIFCILIATEDFGMDPHPNPLVIGTDPRIQIRIRIYTKMSRIRNTKKLTCKETLRKVFY